MTNETKLHLKEVEDEVTRLHDLTANAIADNKAASKSEDANVLRRARESRAALDDCLAQIREMLDKIEAAAH